MQLTWLLDLFESGYLDLLTVLALVGLVVVVIAASKPRHVWLLLVAISIISTGTLLQGLSIVDEYLLACFLLGTFMYVGMRFGVGSPKGFSRIERLHWFLFLLMAAYLVFQAMRGVSELESARKLRWVVFYGMIGLLPLTLYAGRFPLPSRRQVASTVTMSTIVYFAVYLLSGLTAEGIYNGDRYELQTVWWGSTAYSMLPVAIAIPAIFISLRDRDKWYRRLGWTAFLLVILASLYYDSRVGMLAVSAFLIVALPVIGIKRFLWVLTPAVIALLVFTWVIWPTSRTLGFTVDEVYRVVQTAWDPTERAQAGRRDIDRSIYIRASFSSIDSDLSTFLFGHGLRAHGRVISPRLRELYIQYDRPDIATEIKEDASTEGFTALVVDTGLVGLLLLVANFGLVAVQVMRNSSDRYRYILLTSAVILFSWIFVINMLDVTLFYVAIMPSGLLVLMARPSEERAVAEPTPERAWEGGPVNAPASPVGQSFD